jgi:drug/metabolite transporter (DMT)-like permease
VLLTQESVIPLSQTPRTIYPVLAVGLLAISFAAILIRYAQQENISSIYISAFRLLGAAVLLTPIALIRYRDEVVGLSQQDWLLAGTSGVFLALHFAFWTISLEYTTVLISVTLVSTTPIWAALLEWLLLRQPPRNTILWGIIIAIAGSITIGIPATPAPSADVENLSHMNHLLGGILAIAGAVAIAFYLTIGRRVRANLSIFPYIWIVYAMGGLVLVPVLIAQGTPLVGYSATGYFWLIALAIIPQLLGHSSLNYAVKYISATYLSILTKLEPIVSAIIAFFAFQEIPNQWEILGSVLVLIGILIASVHRESEPRKNSL